MASNPFTFLPPPPPPPPPSRINSISTPTYDQLPYTQQSYGSRGRGNSYGSNQNLGQGRGDNARRQSGGNSQFQSRGGHNFGRAQYRGGHGFRGRGGSRPQHHGPDLSAPSNIHGLRQTQQDSPQTPTKSFHNGSPYTQLHTISRAGQPFPPHTYGYNAQPLLQNGYSNAHDSQPLHSTYSHSGSISPPNTSKRPYSTAFASSNRPNTRPQAPPAVPSFGFMPLPAKPPAPSSDSYSPQNHRQKKPRKSNQLGLTPRSQDPEVSSDEDIDEESKLASSGDQSLQFTHRGRTCTLKSDQEIAEWLAERKRKFPTQKKREAALREAAERKLEWEKERKKRNEERQAKLDAAKAQREEVRVDRGNGKSRRKKGKGSRDTDKPAQGGHKNSSPETSNRRTLVTEARLSSSTSPTPKKLSSSPSSVRAEATENAPLDAVIKARLRAEKYRKKALREEAKAREAEAKALAAQKEYEVARHQNKADTKNVTETKARRTEQEPDVNNKPSADIDSSTVATRPDTALLTPTSPLGSTDEIAKHSQDILDNDSISLSSSSTDPSGFDSDSDMTSSSDSSTISASDTDADSNSSSAPESQAIRPVKPIRVAPPSRKGPPTTSAKTSNRAICRQFLRTGRCPRGQGCRFSHDLSRKRDEGRHGMDGGQQRKRGKPLEKERRSGRKGLYQVLVEKEQEEERRKMLEAICWLGERGMLDGEEGKGKGKGNGNGTQKEKTGEMKDSAGGVVDRERSEDRNEMDILRIEQEKDEEEHSQSRPDEQPLATDLLVAAAAAAP